MFFVFNVIPDLPAFVLRTTAGKKVWAIATLFRVWAINSLLNKGVSTPIPKQST